MSQSNKDGEIQTPYGIIADDPKRPLEKWQQQQQQTTIKESSPYFSSIPSSLYQETTDDDDELQWSIFSNIFFVTGCAFYLMASILDYALFRSNPDIDIDLLLNLHQRILYELLWFLCPTIYLLNSVIDVRWAMKVRENDRKRKRLKEIFMNEMKMNTQQQLQDVKNILEKEGTQNKNSKKEMRQKFRFRKLPSDPKQQRDLYYRMCKHMGHRRQLVAASSFGLAAALGVVGAVCYLISTQGKFSFAFHSVRSNDLVIDSNVLATWAISIEKSSMYVYFIHAVIALWQNPCPATREYSGLFSSLSFTHASCNIHLLKSQWGFIDVISRWLNDVESLETIGDIFFAIASVVDIILAVSTLDDKVFWWPIVSSSLCLMDSLFYLRGDFVTLFAKKSSDASSDNLAFATQNSWGIMI